MQVVDKKNFLEYIWHIKNKNFKLVLRHAVRDKEGKMDDQVWEFVINVSTKMTIEEVRQKHGIPEGIPLGFGEPQPEEPGQQGLYVLEEDLPIFDDLLMENKGKSQYYLPAMIVLLIIITFLAIIFGN